MRQSVTGATADAGAKAVGVGHGVEGEGATPAPSPPAKALRVELRILGQRCVDDGQLVLKLHGAEVVIGGLGKVAAAHAGAAIVGVEHGKTMLRPAARRRAGSRSSDWPLPAGRDLHRDSRSAAQRLGWWRPRAAAGWRRAWCRREPSLQAAQELAGRRRRERVSTRRYCTCRQTWQS